MPLHDHVELYGFQNTFAKISARDYAHNPRKQYDGNVWELLRVEGRLDSQLLFRAAEQVVNSIDILKGVVRHIDGKDTFVYDQHRRPATYSFLKVTESFDEFSSSGLKELLRGVALGLRDLQKDPPVHICVITLSKNEHLVLVVMDHMVSDGRTLAMFIRETFMHYQDLKAGIAESDINRKAMPGFFDFAHKQQSLHDLRATSQEFWREQFVRTDSLGCVPRFPQGRQKPLEERFHTDTHEVKLRPETVEAVRGISRNISTPVNLIFLAAVALVASAWTEVLPGIEYFRSGRYARSLVSVPGPLFELVVSLSPSKHENNVLDYIRAYTHSNSKAPPCYGLPVRDLDGGQPSNRMITFNAIPPIREMRVGGLRIRPDYDLASQLYGFRPASRFCLDIQLECRSTQHMTLKISFDPDFIPGGERYGAIIEKVILDATKANTSINEIRSLIKFNWETKPPSLNSVDEG